MVHLIDTSLHGRNLVALTCLPSSNHDIYSTNTVIDDHLIAFVSFIGHLMTRFSREIKDFVHTSTRFLYKNQWG